MASQVQVAKSDIKSKKKKTLLENLVRHAYSAMINVPQYKSLIMEKDLTLFAIMKQNEFR